MRRHGGWACKWVKQTNALLWRKEEKTTSPCARSRIPISRSHCPATFVSQTKSTHFVEENPNLLVVISAELRMLPNERFCSPSLKRSSFLGNKGHVHDFLYQSMQFLPALSIVLLNNYQLFEKNFFAHQWLKCVYSTVGKVNFAFDAVWDPKLDFLNAILFDTDIVPGNETHCLCHRNSWQLSIFLCHIRGSIRAFNHTTDGSEQRRPFHDLCKTGLTPSCSCNTMPTANSPFIMSAVPTIQRTLPLEESRQKTSHTPAYGGTARHGCSTSRTRGLRILCRLHHEMTHWRCSRHHFMSPCLPRQQLPRRSFAFLRIGSRHLPVCSVSLYSSSRQFAYCCGADCAPSCRRPSLPSTHSWRNSLNGRLLLRNRLPPTSTSPDCSGNTTPNDATSLMSTVTSSNDMWRTACRSNSDSRQTRTASSGATVDWSMPTCHWTQNIPSSCRGHLILLVSWFVTPMTSSFMGASPTLWQTSVCGTGYPKAVLPYARCYEAALSASGTMAGPSHFLQCRLCHLNAFCSRILFGSLALTISARFSFVKIEQARPSRCGSHSSPA